MDTTDIPPATVPAPGPAQGDRLDQRVVVAVVYVVTMFMSIMDSTIVNVALPTMARDFSVGPDTVEWVVTGYLLGLALFIPASGWLGDRVGTKRVFLFALAVFTGASVLCGLAGSIDQLLAFRVLQGVGGGMLIPVGTAMLFRAFPPAERARAASILIIPTVVAPATGPVLGGLLVDDLSWRWCFYVNVPMGVAAFVFGFFLLHEHREPARGRFDVAGFVLSGAGLALVLFALSQAPGHGWGSPVVVSTLVTGLVCFAGLALAELRRPDPMLRLSLLGDRLFAWSNLVSLFAYASFLGVLFLLPQFLQEARGASALASGLSTFPEAVGVAAASQLAARAYRRLGPRRLLVAGLTGAGLAMAALSLVGLSTDLWLVRLVMFAMGFSMSFVFISLQTATFATITSADTGQASAIFNTQRQMGAALGVAALTTVLLGFTPAGPADASSALATGFHAAFLAAAVVAWVGAGLSWRIRDADARATMAPRPVP